MAKKNGREMELDMRKKKKEKNSHSEGCDTLFPSSLAYL